jgi:D-alanine-D-alanine ligase-like ATP-grasp enzyme
MIKIKFINKKDTPNIDHILIVDGISTAKFYVESLNKRGYKVSHLRTYPHLKKGLSFGTDDVEDMFSTQINNTEYMNTWDLSDFKDLDDCIKFLKTQKIDLALVGSEIGVINAEIIIKELGFPCNEPSKLHARRDKFLMQNALKEAGLPYVKHIVTKNINDAVNFFNNNNHQPIVLKELLGSGTNNVFICNSVAEVKSRFSEILNAVNIVGNKNNSVLVEEFVTGIETVVNTISNKSIHSTDSVFEYKKILLEDQYPIFDSTTLVNRPTQIQRDAVKYVYKCLDALGIQNGPAHSELFIKSDGSPVLLETGARMGGTYGSTDGFKKSLGEYEFDYILNCALLDESFKEFNSYIYKPVGNYMVKRLISTSGYEINPEKCIDVLMKIPGVLSVSLNNLYVQTKRVQKTTGLLTAPGIVVIWTEKKRDMQKAYEKINDLCFNYPTELYLGNI